MLEKLAATFLLTAMLLALASCAGNGTMTASSDKPQARGVMIPSDTGGGGGGGGGGY